MEGLFKAVTLGVYPPVNQKYSKELSHMIKLMLQQKPKSRPSAEKILSSALIQKKVEELHLESIKADETNQELMKTIRLPKKLHYLTDRLPKPNYDNLSEGDKGSSMKNSPSISKDRNLSKGSLPRINHILLPGLNYVKGDRNRKKKLNNDMLMIEGRSKIIE
jgi:NIMA (never in mitosis gene a)-related kinase